MSESEINKLVAKRLNYFLEINEKTQNDLAEYMGVSQATISNWCKGIKLPRMDKIDRLCAFFNINRSDLMEDKTTPPETYYLNNDAREMAQFLYENPEYKVLFDASRKVKKEDIDFVKQMIDRVRGDSDDSGC